MDERVVGVKRSQIKRYVLLSRIAIHSLSTPTGPPVSGPPKQAIHTNAIHSTDSPSE